MSSSVDLFFEALARMTVGQGATSFTCSCRSSSGKGRPVLDSAGLPSRSSARRGRSRLSSLRLAAQLTRLHDGILSDCQRARNRRVLLRQLAQSRGRASRSRCGRRVVGLFEQWPAFSDLELHSCGVTLRPARSAIESDLGAQLRRRFVDEIDRPCRAGSDRRRCTGSESTAAATSAAP